MASTKRKQLKKAQNKQKKGGIARAGEDQTDGRPGWRQYKSLVDKVKAHRGRKLALQG